MRMKASTTQEVERAVRRILIILVVSILFIVSLGAVSIERIETTENLYLPLIIRNPIMFGGHVINSPELLPDNALAYIPIWLNESVNIQDGILPVLGTDRTIVLGFSHAPEWMQTNPWCECSPPSQEHYADYAALVADKTTQYVQDGYNIIAVSIEREPDNWLDELCDPSGHYVNCWGQDYAGGVAYGELINAVRAILPENIEVWAGELYYRYDLEFIRGMSNANFDCLSFHSYIRDGDFERPWRQVEAIHTVVDVPVCLTETSIFYDGETDFETQKAEYMQYLIGNIGDFRAVGWYTSADNLWPWEYPTDLCYRGQCYEAYYIFKEFLATPAY